ncbi:MAG: hypothetical protein HKO54_11215 [Flavobacteriaceae bacterium]|nr:hypothetical protein [Flavobacteriaceae bacterium]
MKKYISLLIVSFLLIAGTTFAQQQMQQKIDMRIDSIGNAKIKFAMTMTAQEWQGWNASFGNNPAALKREMERGMPGYFLDDFKLEKDDMNRSFELTLMAYGACDIDKRGKWIVETDQKDANLTKITDHKYMLVSSPMEYGGALQQTYTIEFPDDATDIEVDKDALGNSIFKFEMESPGGGFNLLRLSGIALLIIGGGWTGVSLLTGKS